jgi:hypothetical protein
VWPPGEDFVVDLAADFPGAAFLAVVFAADFVTAFFATFFVADFVGMMNSGYLG